MGECEVFWLMKNRMTFPEMGGMDLIAYYLHAIEFEKSKIAKFYTKHSRTHCLFHTSLYYLSEGRGWGTI